MKSYITLLVLALIMILAVPAFAGEEPYKATVYDDSEIPPFYISPKLAQFTHPETFYYGHCYYFFCNTPGPVDPEVCMWLPESSCFMCSSKCKERFSSKIAPIYPEVCCEKDSSECPAIGNSRITSGNSGWYEWVIGLPKKPEGELNIEIECGVLKPNAWEFFGPDAINLCAAETGEVVDPGLCKRMTDSDLKVSALPRITAIAYPGAQNYFKPFHLTAYRNPSQYALTKAKDPDCKNEKGNPINCLNDSGSLQILDGSVKTRFALKACMDKTILVKWPVSGTMNELGEVEANLEAGDLIKVRMDVTLANTVDIYCSPYSVKIGGIGEPLWAPAGELPCIFDECGL
jgi:hypothetical protein